MDGLDFLHFPHIAPLRPKGVSPYYAKPTETGPSVGGGAPTSQPVRIWFAGLLQGGIGPLRLSLKRIV